MRKTSTTYILAGAAVLLIGHLSGCTEGFLDGIRQDPATFPARQSVDVNQARQQLAGLTITPERGLDGYDRDLFPHWNRVEGTCNTREWVLLRDGINVQAGPDCYPTSGTWVSPYDDQTWHHASDVDVDHLVPLAEAWRSGAASWTTARRAELANDLATPQLIAVTDNVNQSKADQDPSTWQPSVSSYRCTYAADWVAVKNTYGLTVDPAEVAALDEMLDACGGAQ